MSNATGLAERKAGLVARSGVQVPLQGVSVEAELSTFSARVTISQRYRNNEAQPIEAVYVFPLDEGAAVCGFEVLVNGVHYVGQVFEREEAFKRYDEAMEQGHGGYLLDEERPDVFQASVGNVPPGGEVLLRLTYVTEVPLEGDSLRFAIPTTVSPRYAPAEDSKGVGRPDSETLNPPVWWRVPYGLDLSVRIDLQAPITRVESPSHPVRVTLDGTKAIVALAQDDAPLDRDFVLLVAPSGADEPAVIVERDEQGRHAALLAFRPTFAVDSVKSEIVFVVDRSGSMGGSSIEQVRNALQLALRSLLPGCRFNIVGFGSKFHALFPDSRDYDEASLREASEHVASLDADLGGTEILPALEFVLNRPVSGERPRQVVVLTDGEVTNTDAVIALARSSASTARLFTFGIGAGASHHLVRGLARAGGGTAEFIYPGERIEPKVMRQVARLLSPALTGVKVDWGGLEVKQAPVRVPPVFAGSPVLVYGLVDKLEGAQVALSANTPSGPVTYALSVDPASLCEGTTIGTLAARALIRELEESPDWTSASGSQQSHRKETRVAREIIELATAYGLVSRETSYVAIEKRAAPVEGDIALRRVPVALTTGWGGLEREAASMQWSISRLAPAPPARALSDTGVVYSLDADSEMLALCDSPTMEPPVERLEAPSVRPSDIRRWGRHIGDMLRSRGSRRTFDLLVALQGADGSWDLSEDLAAAVGRSLPEIEYVMHGSPTDAEARKVWATSLALAWLEREAGDRVDEWQLLARKAQRWLEKVQTSRLDAVDWMEAARSFLSS